MRRVRTSTWILLAVFLGTLVLYTWVKPPAPGTASDSPAGTQQASSPTPTPDHTKRPAATRTPQPSPVPTVTPSPQQTATPRQTVTPHTTSPPATEPPTPAPTSSETTSATP